MVAEMVADLELRHRRYLYRKQASTVQSTWMAAAQQAYARLTLKPCMRAVSLCRSCSDFCSSRCLEQCPWQACTTSTLVCQLLWLLTA